MKTKLYKSPRNYWSIFVSLKRKWPMKKQTPVTAWLTQFTKLTQTNQSTKSASQELKVSHLKITPWPAVIQVSCSFNVYVHTFLCLAFFNTYVDGSVEIWRKILWSHYGLLEKKTLQNQVALCHCPSEKKLLIFLDGDTTFFLGKELLIIYLDVYSSILSFSWKFFPVCLPFSLVRFNLKFTEVIWIECFLFRELVILLPPYL